MTTTDVPDTLTALIDAWMLGPMEDGALTLARRILTEYALVPAPPGWTLCPDPSQLADGTEVRIGDVEGTWLKETTTAQRAGWVSGLGQPLKWMESVLRGTPVFTRTQPPQPEPPQVGERVTCVLDSTTVIGTVVGGAPGLYVRPDGVRDSGRFCLWLDDDWQVFVDRSADDSGPVETVTQQPTAHEYDEEVVDADGIHWKVLNKPNGNEHCNGLYADGSGRQRYGEHMRHPLVVTRHSETPEPEPAEQFYRPGGYYWSAERGPVRRTFDRDGWRSIDHTGRLTDAQVGADTATLPPITPPQSSTPALQSVTDERSRQISSEGYSREHDRRHGPEPLARAAVAYALQRTDLWPWDPDSFRLTVGDRRRELVKAAALLVAAIDALDARSSEPIDGTPLQPGDPITATHTDGARLEVVLAKAYDTKPVGWTVDMPGRHPDDLTAVWLGRDQGWTVTRRTP